MTKKEHVMNVIDESTGLMECLVCGAKHNVGNPALTGNISQKTGSASTRAD